MNERIKQITGQVLDEIVPETWVALGYDKIKEIQNRTAELIVRECLTKIENEAAREYLQKPAQQEPVAYVKTVIEALYENSDPVSVEAELASSRVGFTKVSPYEPGSRGRFSI